jgi:hypothetical protein
MERIFMTEDEAKKKWCPMVRFSHATYGSGESRTEVLGTHNEGAKCISSDCMMWRESGRMTAIVDGILQEDYLPTGYCGLGGKL